ncbi:cytochrome P450 [Hypomontagnella monticulosa]|nr:cytochrome P450 [Hypomontagnella monticulosa]
MYSQTEIAMDRDTIAVVLLLSLAVLPLLSGKNASKTAALITAPFRFFVRRIHAWSYLLNAKEIIEAGYQRSSGKPFEVLSPDVRFTFISEAKHIKELDTAPGNVLSLYAAAKHLLQPVHTMNGFDWFVDRGVEGIGFVRTVRTLLTNNMTKLLPDLKVLARTRFEKLLHSHELVNGNRHSPVYPMVMKLVVLLNAASLFGSDIAKDEEFQEAALSYVEQTLINAEIVKLVPKFLSRPVGEFLARRLDSQKMFFSRLVPIAEQRIQDRDLRSLGHDIPKQADCIQWIMETAPRGQSWPAERIIQELMAIWFGSVHPLCNTIVFAIHDLCLHPEYAEPIRKELDAQYEAFEATGQGLPLLDSFIKESARLTPVESLSTRRCALQPFTFSDGTKLAVGEWAVTPCGAIMRSEEHYPAASEFNGFRFVDPEILKQVDNAGSFSLAQPKPSKLTDVDNSFLMWGTGRMACPGRFYATAIMKVILGHIIMNYDCSLVEPSAPRSFTWRTATVPKDEAMVVFTPR